MRVGRVGASSKSEVTCLGGASDCFSGLSRRARNRHNGNSGHEPLGSIWATNEGVWIDTPDTSNAASSRGDSDRRPLRSSCQGGRGG